MICTELRQTLLTLESKVKAKLPKHTFTFREPVQTSWADVRKNPGPTGLPPQYSLIPAGREVYVEVKDEEGKVDVAATWGVCVPAGLVPWDRYPIGSSPSATTFHSYGLWSPILDHLVSVGRGEWAWPSLCAAAQVEAKSWEGTHPQEREIQALLHLKGYNPGPIDGELGNVTMGVLRSMGFGHLPLGQVLVKLAREKPEVLPGFAKPMKGRWILPEAQFSINTFGSVRAKKDTRGATVEVKGPGRLVIDIHGKTHALPTT